MLGKHIPTLPAQQTAVAQGVHQGVAVDQGLAAAGMGVHPGAGAATGCTATSLYDLWHAPDTPGPTCQPMPQTFAHALSDWHLSYKTCPFLSSALDLPSNLVFNVTTLTQTFPPCW